MCPEKTLLIKSQVDFWQIMNILMLTNAVSDLIERAMKSDEDNPLYVVANRCTVAKKRI